LEDSKESQLRVEYLVQLNQVSHVQNEDKKGGMGEKKNARGEKRKKK